MTLVIAIAAAEALLFSFKSCLQCRQSQIAFDS